MNPASLCAASSPRAEGESVVASGLSRSTRSLRHIPRSRLRNTTTSTATTRAAARTNFMIGAGRAGRAGTAGSEVGSSSLDLLDRTLAQRDGAAEAGADGRGRLDARVVALLFEAHI